MSRPAADRRAPPSVVDDGPHGSESGGSGPRTDVALDRAGASPVEDLRTIDALRQEASLAGRLRAALNLVEDGVVVCDGYGTAIFRNAIAESHLGSSSNDVLAEQAVGDALALALQGESAERTLELFSPSPRTLVIRAFPLEGPVQPRGAVAIVQDTSDRHRLDAIRRDFVANVSHEMKTPVAALSLLAETLEGEDDPDVVARLLSRVGAEAERLGRIIDDLLDLSRIEANETPLQEIVPLAVIVGQAVEQVRSAASSSDVRLEVDDPPRHLAVPGNRQDLVSAVRNLVDNAIKYSERGSLVKVGTRVDGDAVEISVVDQGVGIPDRDKERIFERFYRVDRARSRLTGGTGLGLSIVRNVAVKHSGSVHVDSREGEGSTFTLRLPACRIAPCAPDGSSPEGAATYSTDRGPGEGASNA